MATTLKKNALAPPATRLTAMMRLNREFSAPFTSRADLVGLDPLPVDRVFVLRKSILSDACKSQWYWAAWTPQRLRNLPSRRVTVCEDVSADILPLVQVWPAMSALNAR